MNKIILYKNSSNREVIVDYINSFPNDDIEKIRIEIKLLKEFGLSLMSTLKVKKIVGQSNLFELRIRSSIQIRLFFTYFSPNIFLILHAFVKKTNKTPLKEIKIAVKRKKEFDK